MEKCWYSLVGVLFLFWINVGTGQCGLTCGFKRCVAANVWIILVKPQRRKAVACQTLVAKEYEDMYYSFVINELKSCQW